jgi:hypothetical protein
MVHLGDAVLPQLLQLVALLEEDGVPEVQLRNQMAERLQKNLLELIGDLLRLQVAQHFVEEIYDLGCLLALGLSLILGRLAL